MIRYPEFLELLEIEQKKSNPEFVYQSGPIIYRNLDNFNRDGDYLKSYRITGSNVDPYFVKSEAYKDQNEWRLIIDGSQEKLPTDEDGSYRIKMGKLTWAYIFETLTFLNTFSDDKK